MDPMAMFPVDLSLDLNLVSNELMQCRMRYHQDVWQVICDKALSMIGGGARRAWRRPTMSPMTETVYEPGLVRPKSTTPGRSSLSPSKRMSRTSQSPTARMSRQSRVSSRRQSESPAKFSQRQSVRKSERQSQRKSKSPIVVPPVDDDTPSRSTKKKSSVSESRRSSVKPTPKKSSIATPSSESKKKKTGEEEDDEDDDEDDDDKEGEEESNEDDDENANNRASRLRQLSLNNRSNGRRFRRRKSSLLSSSAESESASTFESKESVMSKPDGSSFETSYSTDVCDRSYRSRKSRKSHRSKRSLSKRKKMMTPTATLAAANNAIAELAGLLRRSLGSDAFSALGRVCISAGHGDVDNRLGSACPHHKSNPSIESGKSQLTPSSHDTETCDGASCTRETCERRQKQLHLQLEQSNQQLRNSDVSRCHRCKKPRK